MINNALSSQEGLTMRALLTTRFGRDARFMPLVAATLLFMAATAIGAYAQPGLHYQWTLDTDPGWTCDPTLWAFGQPTGQGGAYGCPDPASGYTGTNVYGYNLAGDYPNYMSATEYLTSGTIDCTDLAAVELRFWRWLSVESSNYDHASIDVSSDDGVNWINIWANGTTTIDDCDWVQQIYDISAIADNQPGVRIRWGMGPTDSSWQYCGWNIDDVEIWAAAISPVNSSTWGGIKAVFR
jgi:hypothetical protein